jgi:hypothetical protein
MSARKWAQGREANTSLPVDSTITRYLDDFAWQQVMTHNGTDQGVLTCPSDKDTVASDSSPQDPEVSIYQITATDHDNFHDEEWGMVEFAGEHPFEDYDEWFHEEEEECETNTDDDKPDFH